MTGDEEVAIIIRSVYHDEAVTLRIMARETIAEVKRQLQREFLGAPHPDTQKLIFCGRICGDAERLEDVLRKMDVSFAQTFHLVLAKHETRQQRAREEIEEAFAATLRREMPSSSASAENTLPQRAVQPPQQQQRQQTATVAFDTRSVEVARRYLQSGDVAYLPVDTQIILSGMFSAHPAQTEAVLLDQDEAFLAEQAQEQQRQQQQAALEGGRPRLWFLDFKLILRLAAVIFLFSQGDTSRSYSMIIAALVYYVFATGIVQWLLSLVNPLPGPATPAAAADAPDGSDAPPEEVGMVRTAVNLAHGMIPRTPGILMDVFCFVSTFSLSLYPSWHVGAAA